MTAKLTKLAIVAIAIGLASTMLVEARVRYEQRDPLVMLTYDLEESTRDVMRDVARRNRHVNRREELALQRLHELQRETRQFRRDIFRHGAWSFRVRNDYEELQQAFRRARKATASIRPFRRGLFGFGRVTEVMRRLDYTYERRLAFYRRYNRRHEFDRGNPAVFTRPGPGRHGGRLFVDLTWDDEFPDDDFPNHRNRRHD
jgi:hypothetical protein